MKRKYNKALDPDECRSRVNHTYREIRKLPSGKSVRMCLSTWLMRGECVPRISFSAKTDIIL